MFQPLLGIKPDVQQRLIPQHVPLQFLFVEVSEGAETKDFVLSALEETDGSECAGI